MKFKNPNPVIKINSTAILSVSFFIITGLVFSGNSLVLAADSWNIQSSMPTARYTATATTVNNKVYVIGGENYSSMNLTANEEYDPATNSWATRAPMPTGRRVAVATVAFNKIYTMGGAVGNSTTVATNEEYDPATNSWATRAPMPTGRNSAAAAMVANKIYVIGGLTGSLLDPVTTNEEYDPATNSWATRTPMPTARWGLTASAASSKIYAVGGAGKFTTTPNSINEEYDPVTNSWATRTPIPSQRLWAASFSINNRVYVTGGWPFYSNGVYQGTTYNPINEEYDPATNSWARRAQMPTARGFATASVVNNKAYVLGGYRIDLAYLDANEEYTPPLFTPPTVTFAASPIFVLYNNTSTLSWSSWPTFGANRATNCTAGGAWSGFKNIGGSENTGNLTSSQTYTLFCSGDGGVSDIVSASVNVAPPGDCLSPWGGFITNGDSVTAYKAFSVNAPAACLYETRTCNSSVLSGTYLRGFCIVYGVTVDPATSSITLGQSVNFSSTATLWSGAATQHNLNWTKVGSGCWDWVFNCPTVATASPAPSYTFSDASSHSFSTTLTPTEVGVYNVQAAAYDGDSASWVYSTIATITVSAAPCANGATNPSLCDQCLANYAYYLASCVACSNGGCTGPGGSASNPNGSLTCNNGALNPPFCNSCPGSQTFVAGSCVANCANGATNPSACNTCPVGQTLVAGSCVVTTSCGDGICSGAENPLTCAKDCKVRFRQF